MTSPVILHFSGGRSSAVMVKKYLEEYDVDTPVIFCNTGMETRETLIFVAAFVSHLKKKYGYFYLPWLEFALDKDGKPTYREVNFNTADKEGNVFFNMVKSSKFIPSRQRRQCTTMLKVETAGRFIRKELGLKEWTSAVGFRADEPRRVAAMNAKNEHIEFARNGGRDAEGKKIRLSADAQIMAAPLDEWSIDKGGVMREIAEWEWVKDLPFDALNPNVQLSNCDGCFYGNLAKHIKVCVEKPAMAARWDEMEQWRQKNGAPKFNPPEARVAWYKMNMNAELPENEQKKNTLNDLYSWSTLRKIVQDGAETLPLRFDDTPTAAGCGDGFCGTD